MTSQSIILSKSEPSTESIISVGVSVDVTIYACINPTHYGVQTPSNLDGAAINYHNGDYYRLTHYLGEDPNQVTFDFTPFPQSCAQNTVSLD